MRGIAHRNVQFVRGDHSKCGVSKFPPELVTDDGDLDRTRGHAGILYRMDDAGRSHEEHQHNEHRNYCPGELHLIAAVHLRRFRALLGTPAELCNDISNQSENNYENEASNGQHQ